MSTDVALELNELRQKVDRWNLASRTSWPWLYSRGSGQVACSHDHRDRGRGKWE